MPAAMFTLAATFLCLAVASQTNATETVCDMISKDLPSDCTCSGKLAFSGIVDCKVAVFAKDKVGFRVNVAPCADPAHVDFTVTESAHGINFTAASVQAGREEDFVVPGASLALPGVGKVGLTISALIDGDLDELTAKVGLNACGEIAKKKVCGSSLTELLPFWVLHGTYNFGHMCKGFGSSSVFVE